MYIKTNKSGWDPNRERRVLFLTYDATDAVTYHVLDDLGAISGLVASEVTNRIYPAGEIRIPKEPSSGGGSPGGEGVVSQWMFPKDGVPVDFSYFAPTPFLRSWKYTLANGLGTKCQFMAFPCPVSPSDANAVEWMTCTPVGWKIDAMAFTPYLTYKFGPQGGVNPDQPAFVPGDFGFQIVNVTLNPAGEHMQNWWTNPPGGLDFAFTAVNNSDLVYAGATQTVMPSDAEAVGILAGIPMYLQLWRDIDAGGANRTLDVIGIRIDYNVTAI